MCHRSASKAIQGSGAKDDVLFYFLFLSFLVWGSEVTSSYSKWPVNLLEELTLVACPILCLLPFPSHTQCMYLIRERWFADTDMYKTNKQTKESRCKQPAVGQSCTWQNWLGMGFQSSTFWMTRMWRRTSLIILNLWKALHHPLLFAFSLYVSFSGHTSIHRRRQSLHWETLSVWQNCIELDTVWVWIRLDLQR